MRISEAAKKTGLTEHTIRFYERAGMVPRISRTENGTRDFSSDDINWLLLLYYLRETGMPMKTMKLFTTLAQLSGDTYEERRKILLHHRATLQSQREKLDRCEEALNQKIEGYYAKESQQK